MEVFRSFWAGIIIERTASSYAEDKSGRVPHMTVFLGWQARGREPGFGCFSGWGVADMIGCVEVRRMVHQSPTRICLHDLTDLCGPAYLLVKVYGHITKIAAHDHR